MYDGRLNNAVSSIVVFLLGFFPFVMDFNPVAGDDNVNFDLGEIAVEDLIEEKFIC